MRGRVSSVNNIFIVHIPPVRRAGIRIDCCAIWAGHFGRCGRDRDDSCRAGRGMALAGNAKDRRAGPESALVVADVPHGTMGRNKQCGNN